MQLFFNGPESFTPDDRYLLGETPEARGLFVAAGFNSIGVQSAGGAGKVLADWIVDGHPPMDLWDVDIRRMAPFQRNRRYLRERTVEGLGLLYAMHWPFRQPESARGVRRSALHDRLKAAGACFGETAGWERPNWFAPPGVAPEYEYSYGRQNWFAHSAAEHRAVREAVGLFDQSSFGKFVVEGPDAEAALDRICANDIAVPDRPRRLHAMAQRARRHRGRRHRHPRIRDPLPRRHRPPPRRRAISPGSSGSSARRARVAVDVTSGFAVLASDGAARARRAGAGSPTPISPTPPSRSERRRRSTSASRGRGRAASPMSASSAGSSTSRPSSRRASTTCSSRRARRSGSSSPAITRMNSLRIEKAYRHWGHDITEEDTPDEAGLGFAVKINKPAISSAARRCCAGARRACGAGSRNSCWRTRRRCSIHNEPVFRDGRLVGRIASGMFGHTVGRAIGLGYVENGGAVVAAGMGDVGRLRDRNRRPPLAGAGASRSRSTIRKGDAPAHVNALRCARG